MLHKCPHFIGRGAIWAMPRFSLLVLCVCSLGQSGGEEGNRPRVLCVGDTHSFLVRHPGLHQGGDHHGDQEEGGGGLHVCVLSRLTAVHCVLTDWRDRRREAAIICFHITQWHGVDI